MLKYDRLTLSPTTRILGSALLASALLSLSAPSPALAQISAPYTHQQSDQPAGIVTASAEADGAYTDALAKMHRDMAIAPTGHPDLDFVQGMLAHHQGAIDMAEVVLAHGKDPEVKALAQAIIKAQEAEMDWMRDWLSRNGR